MSKLVVLKIAEGSFEVGFTATLQIGEEGQRPSIEITGKLPALPEIPLYYSHWQSSYRNLGNNFRLFAEKVQVTNVSRTQDCRNSAEILRARFNTWLRSEEFRPIREKILERLLPSDEVRFILQTQNSQLQRLPWHLWEICDRYPKSEIALASPVYEHVAQNRTPNNKVNILAIVGNSLLIDTQADQILLQNLPDANCSLLLEPNRKELTDHLWGKDWDILFFAGHSSTNNNGSGRIYLNQTDSLTIEELKFGLRRAVERGLQLAIFNSCDGLGLAKELADLQIPQIIVMRELVPDLVAQEFLKYFLQAFSQGNYFHLAVREARERLQGLEDQFPCATWLPVICQNPAQTMLAWRDLIQIQPIPIPSNTSEPIARKKPGKKRVLLSSLAMAAVICGLRFLGILESFELQSFDQMMRSRPSEGSDNSLLVVTIDENDLATQRRNNENLRGASISDRSLNLLLKKLEEYQPRVIGLDIYRDFPATDGELATRLKQLPNLVGVCKGSDTTEESNGIAPPPEINQQQLGFSDFIADRDDVVRRHLLFMQQEPASLCPVSNSFSLQLAARYLAKEKIPIKYTSSGNLQIGNVVFNGLNSRANGYQGIEVNDPNQILLNYRATKEIAERVTLTEILSGQVSPKAVKDRVVLVGVLSRVDYPDYWATPYGSNFKDQMPGVIVQAHMVSQIINAVSNGRPLLRVWSLWIDLIWIYGWSILGGLLLLRAQSFWQLLFAIALAIVFLYGVSFVLLISGYWTPFIPSLLTFLGSAWIVAIKNPPPLTKGGLEAFRQFKIRQWL